jgi:hypothetical protein
MPVIRQRKIFTAEVAGNAENINRGLHRRFDRLTVASKVGPLH